MAVNFPPPSQRQTNSVTNDATNVANAVPATETAEVATTTAVTTESTAAPETGAPAATGDLAALAARGQQVAAGIGQLAAHNFQPSPDLFSLVPGRTPDAVGLDVVLKQLSKDPNAAGMVKGLIADLEAQTGVKVPAAAAAAAMANPERLTEILRLTPKQMSEGLGALAKAHASGQVPPVPPRQHLLPKKFDFSDLDNVAYTRPQPAPSEIAPGLFRGGFPNPKVDDAQAKASTVMAEIFDRLSDNANLPSGDRFAVEFDGSTFTRVDTFLEKLRENGHEVTATVEHRVANFAELLTKAPNGAFIDVPTPLMVDVTLDGAKKVPVPSIHSEVVFEIKSGPKTTGPKVPDTKIKWYQGISATGFFPADLNKTPNWTGKTTTDTFTGAKADKALELAGLMGDVINQASKDQGLYASGYGLTGVCNDSVAVVEMALTGRATSYPLLMQDDLLLPELDKRLSDSNRRDDPGYRALRDAIQTLPSDVDANDTMYDRALTSIPWAAGNEPFQSTVDARSALEQSGAKQI